MWSNEQTISWGQAGAAGISAIGNAALEYYKYKQLKAIQKYNNKMANLSNAMNQNAISMNRSLAIQQFTRTSEQIQRKGLIATGQVQADAAASGTVGNSVTMMKQVVTQAQAAAEYQNRQNMENKLLIADAQSRNSAMAALMQQDIGQKQSPNFLLAVAQGAGSMSKILGEKETGGFNSGSAASASSQNFGGLSALGTPKINVYNGLEYSGIQFNLG